MKRWAWVTGAGALVLGGALAALALRPGPKVVRDHRTHAPSTAPHAARGSLPDILLVTVDTLRVDHVSTYGYARDTTPFLTELASQGLRYERAYSTSSWTLPAMASMVTGVWPARHGAVDIGEPSGNGMAQPPLPAEVPSLPELLRARGYQTFAVTTNIHLKARFGFDRGFDRFTCLGFEPAGRIVPVLDAWEPALRDGPPWFLWVHLLEPHAPYRRRPRFEAFGGTSKRGGRPLTDANLRAAAPDALPTMLRESVAAYDSEIHYADAAIERLFARLPRAREALTLITADHGEEFGEHGFFGHINSLREPLVHVPLVIHEPGLGRSEVVTEPVSLVDILPTLARVAGVDVPEDAVGVDLLGALDPHRPIVLEVSRNVDLQGVVQDGWKLVRRPDGSPPSLFHLDRDPAERRDLATEHPQRVADLTAVLDAHFAGIVTLDTEPVPLDEEHVHQLEALGYVE